MIALERKETVQRNHEAAVKCLQSKGFVFNRHKDANSVEGLPKLKDEGFAPPGGGNYVKPEHTLVSESGASAKEFHKSPPYSPVFGSWPNFHPFSKNVQYWQYAFGNQIRPYPINTHPQYAQVGFFPQSYPFENQLQEFQYFVVIDFEATCEEGKIPNPQEIIEFPSVIVNGVTGQLEACFQTYVKPTCNQKLSDFCKDLTGIQQNQVDRGITLSEALLSHDRWLEDKGLKNGNFAVVTWSNWDCRVMLESECQYKDIRKPDYYNRWINLKIPFQHVFGGGRFIKLKEAVELSGLTWQGRPHCGLDDAKNTARLLSVIMQKGFKFSITNELEGQSITNPASPAQHPMMFQFYPCCFCGVKSKKGRFCKPGPKLGSFFFSCGNWTPAQGNLCVFFQWANQ